jgi:hypothetical protein
MIIVALIFIGLLVQGTLRGWRDRDPDILKGMMIGWAIVVIALAVAWFSRFEKHTENYNPYTNNLQTQDE